MGIGHGVQYIIIMTGLLGKKNTRVWNCSIYIIKEKTKMIYVWRCHSIIYIKYLYLLCLKFIDIFFICCLVKFKSFLAFYLI